MKRRIAVFANGIELKDENICYTNWEYITSLNYAMEFSKRKNRIHCRQPADGRNRQEIRKQIR